MKQKVRLDHHRIVLERNREGEVLLTIWNTGDPCTECLQAILSVDEPVEATQNGAIRPSHYHDVSNSIGSSDKHLTFARWKLNSAKTSHVMPVTRGFEY